MLSGIAHAQPCGDAGWTALPSMGRKTLYNRRLSERGIKEVIFSARWRRGGGAGQAFIDITIKCAAGGGKGGLVSADRKAD